MATERRQARGQRLGTPRREEPSEQRPRRGQVNRWRLVGKAWVAGSLTGERPGEVTGKRTAPWVMRGGNEGASSEVPQGRLRVLWASIVAPAGSALHRESRVLRWLPCLPQAWKLSRGPQGIPRGSSQADDSPMVGRHGSTCQHGSHCFARSQLSIK